MSTIINNRMQAWLIALVVSIALTLAALHFVDDPLARLVSLQALNQVNSPAFRAPILITLAAAIVIAGAIQSANGRSKFAETLLIAAFAFTWSVCITELLLKTVFGRQTPVEYLQSGVDTFRWFQGTPFTSFPSGHAVQIVSIGTTFLMAYPRQRPVWLALMGFGLALLILANFHFVSDVIAGSTVGAIGGAATMTLWRKHRSTPGQGGSSAARF
jgi:membrane-associated phospholipid phosphatase